MWTTRPPAHRLLHTKIDAPYSHIKLLHTIFTRSSRALAVQ